MISVKTAGLQLNQLRPLGLSSFKLKFQKYAAASVCALFLFGNAPPPAAADQYFDYGLKLFQQHRFKEAARYFDIRLRSNPNDAYAQYYRALCHHYLLEYDKAKELYNTITATAQDQRIKTLAQSQLAKLETAGLIANAGRLAGIPKLSGPAPGSGGQSPTSTAGTEPPPELDSDMASGPFEIPQNARAYFTVTPGGNDIVLPGKINNRGLNFKFDTGAHSIFIGKNQLEQIGVRPPQGKATSKASGVGGTVETWSMRAQVTIAGITKNCPLTVCEHYDEEPLLGQMFFEDLEYEIDNRGHCIYFRKPMDIKPGDSSDQYSIPFRKKGKHLVVALEGPKGKKTDILVDTGAVSVMFSKSNMTDLDLDLPPDAEEVSFYGVGGSSSGRKFMVDELRLGPIIMRHIPVILDTGQKGMIGNDKAKEGLLGQEFFSSWRFAIDNKNQRLRFFH